MNLRFRDRRGAQALQKALERHERLIAEGADILDAEADAASRLDPQMARLFGLAVALVDAAAPVPEPKFADAFAARLSGVQVVQTLPRLRSRVVFPGFGFAAAAAAIAVVAGLLVPAFRSLPGDPLYALKRASESARVGVVSGPTEARLRLTLAADRFQEVQLLVERAQTRELAPGLGAIAADEIAEDIKDVRIARLIEETLADAQEQIEVAAEILIAQPAATEDLDNDLDDLVEIARVGRELASAVVEDLPEREQTPVLNTVITLTRIEAEAKAAQTKVEEHKATEQPTPPPCDTPTPSPSPAAGEASPSPEATTEPASPSPEPAVTPEPTPCVSPSPTPTPTPTSSPTVEPTAEATPAPTPQAEEQSSAEKKEDGRPRASNGGTTSSPRPTPPAERSDA